MTLQMLLIPQAISATLALVVVWELVSAKMFYATGHRAEFNALQFASAFIGFDEYNFWSGVAIIGMNTWVGTVVLSLTYGLLALSGSAPATSEPSSSFAKITALRLFLHTLWLLNGMASTHIQRRHLMVWRVFAPKYVFDALNVIIADVFAAAAVLLFHVATQRLRSKPPVTDKQK
jgi:phosphatidylinositol glycan class O